MTLSPTRSNQAEANPYRHFSLPNFELSAGKLTCGPMPQRPVDPLKGNEEGEVLGVARAGRLVDRLVVAHGEPVDKFEVLAQRHRRHETEHELVSVSLGPGLAIGSDFIVPCPALQGQLECPHGGGGIVGRRFEALAAGGLTVIGFGFFLCQRRTGTEQNQNGQRSSATCHPPCLAARPLFEIRELHISIFLFRPERGAPKGVYLWMSGQNHPGPSHNLGGSSTPMGGSSTISTLSVRNAPITDVES